MLAAQIVCGGVGLLALCLANIVQPKRVSMKVRIEVEIDDDSFQPMPGHEMARILRGVADEMDSRGQCTAKTLHDCNGNHVGDVCLLGDWE